MPPRARRTTRPGLPFTGRFFETELEDAAYLDVSDGLLPYGAFRATVPLYARGIGAVRQWGMAKGDLDDPDICPTNLYIYVMDGEGGLLPCADPEVGTGPSRGAKNKVPGCRSNEPTGYTFIEDRYDPNLWGVHHPAVSNLPRRMWVR